MKNATSTKKAGTKTPARKSTKTSQAASAEKRLKLDWYLDPLKPAVSKEAKEKMFEHVYAIRLARFLSAMRAGAENIDEERQSDIHQELKEIRQELAAIKELLVTPRPLIVKVPGTTLMDSLPRMKRTNKA